MPKNKDSQARKPESKASQRNDAKSDAEGSADEVNFSDPEDFVDDITDEELLGDILKQRPTETDGIESIIVVDGVPQVGPDRLEKLKNVINKLFTKFGPIVNELYPTDEKGHTKGYIFLVYGNPAHAIEAVKNTNNHKLDKQHTFLVNLFTDFNKYANIPDEWEPPKPQVYENQTNLFYYLLEPDAYDHFAVVLCQSTTTVQMWQNTQPDPSLLAERNGWTTSYTRWSPLGTYFATFHKQGIALWVGPLFSQYRKYCHNNASFIDFSPCEKYLVTYSLQCDSHPHNAQPAIIIWDVRTGMEKRSFAPEGPCTWPMFKWSHDDKYFARIGTDILSIYETPSFGLLEKKSIKINGIRDFSWSPTDNTVAYWVAEDQNVPASVTLLEIPNRNEIRKKNLFNVADCKIHWQRSGDFLCVKVDRYSKVRKEKNESAKYSGMYCNFEIFHMREKQIPVDSVECKESIQAFAWEPVGNKFAVIHGETPSINVSFYEVRIGQQPNLQKKLEKRACNHLFWAPNGQYIVLAGIGQNGGGALEFIDTHDFTVMNTTDHYGMTDVEWDPTGRYLMTAVSTWKVKVDQGYWIWSFQGKSLKKNPYDKFAQFLWRPRPPTLLSEEKQKEIKKNLKKYYPQFESKDRMRQSKASKELLEKRAASMQKFSDYRDTRLKEYARTKQRRLELRNGIDTDDLDADLDNTEEEIVEFLIKEEVFVLE